MNISAESKIRFDFIYSNDIKPVSIEDEQGFDEIGGDHVLSAVDDVISDNEKDDSSGTAEIQIYGLRSEAENTDTCSLNNISAEVSNSCGDNNDSSDDFNNFLENYEKVQSDSSFGGFGNEI